MRTCVRAIVLKDDHLLVMARNKHGQQYYSLVGGGVNQNETLEQGLTRELREETGLQVANLRLVVIETSQRFGVNHVYLCDYVSGQPKLDESSEEAASNRVGQDLYGPMWLPIKDLATIKLLPTELKQLLIAFIISGFPDQPIELTIKARDSL